MNKTKQPKQVKKSRLVLFGNAHDPDLQDSINRAGITGRKVEVTPRPSFDTGLGKCGKHLCNCKHVCVNSYSEAYGR